MLTDTQDLMSLHERLGHAGLKRMSIHLGRTVSALPVCDGCAIGKGVAQGHRMRRSEYRATSVLSVVHADGVELGCESPYGNHCVTHVVDEFSYYTWDVAHQRKSQRSDDLISIIRSMSTGHGKHPSQLAADGEFVTNTIQDYCNTTGTILSPHAP